MDWPIATQLRDRPDETDGVGTEPRLFFPGDEQASDRLGIITPSPASPADKGQSRRPGRRVTAFLLAAGAAGLVAYGVITRPATHRAGIGHPVSPAANSAAAINLPPPNLLRQLSPQEAAEENADRPFISRPDTPASRFVLRTDGADRDRALTCLAQAVYYEAAGEGVDGQRAVAQIVLNRMHHPGFASTVCGVVYQGGDRATGCQFSFVCDGSMQRIPVPSSWTRARQIAEQALAGKVFAPVGHATHYHADYVLPFWADSLDKSVQVGHHIFYRLRGIFGDARAFSQRYGGTEPLVRVPGAAVVIPPAVVTPQLVNALTGDSAQGLSRDVEKAGSRPGPQLAADSVGGTLLAESVMGPQAARKPAASSECSAFTDHRQMAPLSVNDMRVSAQNGGC